MRDPAAYFAHIDAHYMVVSEQLAREDADRHGDRRELRFWIEQRSQSLMEMTPLPPREDTFLDDLGDEVVDPRRRLPWCCPPGVTTGRTPTLMRWP